MTPVQYLEGLLAKYNLTEGQVENLKARRRQIEDLLKYQIGNIEAFYYSGSYAKGTAINLSFDLDVCPYFRRTSFGTLREMYYTVRDILRSEGFNANEQTVSIHVNLGGNDIDVVPARSLSDGSGNANLYVSTQNASIQTNIPVHKDYISKSQARPVIKLAKVWRYRHGIHLKSFALELLVIKALETTRPDAPIDAKLLTALTFARDHATDARLVDPANSSNVISDVVPSSDKQNLANQAGASLKEQYWEKVIW